MNTSDNNCAACRTELIKQVRVDDLLSESEALPIIKSLRKHIGRSDLCLLRKECWLLF